MACRGEDSSVDSDECNDKVCEEKDWIEECEVEIEKELPMPLSEHHAKDSMSNEEEDAVIEVIMSNMSMQNDFKSLSREDLWISDKGTIVHNTHIYMESPIKYKVATKTKLLWGTVKRWNRRLLES